MTVRRASYATSVALASAAILTAGCGGSGKSAGPASTIPVAAAKPAAGQPTAPAKGHGGGAHPVKTPRHRHHRKAKRGSKPSGKTGGQVVGTIPVSKRAGVAKGVAATTFQVFGLQAQTVSASPNGDTVRATIPAGDACSTSPGVQGKVTARIRQAAPFVRTVQITVGGTGKALDAYVRTSCHGLGLPAGGKGPILLTLQGTNFRTTKSFTVRSRHWTVEYVNGGKFLQIFPIKGGRPTTGAFTATKRGSGRHVFAGAGTYTLRIGGLGSWTIRVRDGA